MTGFNPGNKVILIEGTSIVRDYVFVVVESLPKSLVMIYREDIGQPDKKHELVVPLAALVPAEEVGYELLPPKTTTIEIGWEYFRDRRWHTQKDISYSNHGNWYPVRRKLSDAS